MDNDTTTIAHVHNKIDPTIKKKSDSNHTKKNVIGDIFTLAAKHSTLKNPKVRGYLTRCIMYAMQQNQCKPDALQKRLEEIVPHMYGNLFYFTFRSAIRDCHT